MEKNLLKQFQERIILNKKNKGFPIGDFDFELKKMKEELKEVEQALINGTTDDLGQELADLTIYCLAVAEMKGLDLQNHILRKMEKNEKRTIFKNEDGSFGKKEGSTG